MSTGTTMPIDERRIAAGGPPADATIAYRAVHSGAIFSVALALLSLPMGVMLAGSGVYTEILLSGVLPLASVAVAAVAYRSIRARRDQYVGEKATLFALVLSAVVAIACPAYGSYVYATEVPEGYVRTSFLDLKPSQRDEQAQQWIPADVADLAGERIFVKGYIRPDSINSRRNIREFLLVRDNNQCCYGDLAKVKYYDQIYVEMTGDRVADYTEGILRVGGTLEVHPQNLSLGPGAPVYSLKADYIQ